MNDILEQLNDSLSAGYDSLSAGYSELRKEAAEEIMRLRAKIEAMERQKPVGWLLDGDFYEVRQMSLYKDNEPLQGQTALYALRGAQPETRAPEGWKLVPIEPTPRMKTAGIGVEVYLDSPASSDCLTWSEVEAIYTAMLAAAPEAKP